MTLHEGLVQFHKKNRMYFSKRAYSQDGINFLRCHDIAHVVFGCDTTLYGEGVVKIWTTFGTNMSFWQVTKGYREVAAFDLSRKYSLKHVMSHIFSLLIVIPQVIWRSKQMSKPWPFSDFSPYLNTPISKIREEFNISII